MNLILQIIQILVDVAWWIIIAQVILSWLMLFNVVNLSNDVVRSIWNGLNAMTEPFYRLIRRVLPDFGSLDLSPMVALLILIIIDTVLLPAAFRATAPYAI